jgi:hypothetical protein
MVAVTLAAALAVMMLAGPLRGATNWKEATLFRGYPSIVAALGAGFGEEIVFRGYGSELAWSGAGRVSQVMAAALIFGLAHARWASLGFGSIPRAARLGGSDHGGRRALRSALPGERTESDAGDREPHACRPRDRAMASVTRGEPRDPRPYSLGGVLVP